MSNVQSFLKSTDLFFDINTNRENLDLKTEIGEDLYNSKCTKRVIIPSSVTVGSATTSNAALKIPSGVGGNLFIDNYGSIQGAGGAAGNAGGDAIQVESYCRLENKSTGTIYGGGGGGGTGGTGGTGGQGQYTYVTGSYPVCTWSGRYGCYAYGTAYNYGTAYTTGGAGGSGGSGGVGRGYNQSLAAGSSGSSGSAGQDGNAGYGGVGGTGGTGGDWGKSGNTGATGPVGANGNYTNGVIGSSGLVGGSAGYYVKEIGVNINFVNNGTLAGLPRLPATYETLSFTASGNLTVTGGGTDTVSIFKTSGGSAWDNAAYSTTSFTAPCTIEFNKQADSGDNGASYAMIGWNEDPTTNSSYTKLDYAFYPYATSNFQVYHNGSLVQNGGTWSTSDKLYVVYGTDGYIRHYSGSTLLYSVNYGTGKTVYVDSAYYSPNATYGGFSNIRVTNNEWTGTYYDT